MTTTRKKKKTISIIFIIILIISGVGGKYLMYKRTEHERQVAFLKEHEAEMTEYIKSQNSKIETVEYDWDSVEVGTIGNGTPQGAGEILTIDGKFNNITNSSLTVAFSLKDKSSIPNMDAIYLLVSLRILENGVWEIYE
jgi:hypothetical protein